MTFIRQKRKQIIIVIRTPRFGDNLHKMKATIGPCWKASNFEKITYEYLIFFFNQSIKNDILCKTFFVAATYILPCQRNDPQINQCIKRSFNHLKPFLGKGLAEINVPPLEPLLIEQMNMDNDAGAVRIKARFSEILAKGASNYTIKEVRSDVKVFFVFEN